VRVNESDLNFCNIFVALSIASITMINDTKVKLYPGRLQKVLLEKHFDSCRFVYNYFLNNWDENYIANKGAKKSSLNYLDTANMLPELKREYLFRGCIKLILNRFRCPYAF